MRRCGDELMGCGASFPLATGNSILLSDPLVVDESHGQFAPEVVNGGDLNDLLWPPDEVSEGEPGVDL